MPAQTTDMPRLRVLCVSSYFPEHGGGVERIAHDIAQHFAGDCHWQTTLAANRTDGTAEAAPSAYTRFEIGCWNGIEAMTGFPLILPNPIDVLRLLFRINRHDLVMVHDEIYVANLVAILWALMTRVPLIVVKHTGIVPLRNRPVLDGLLKFVTGFVTRPLLRHAARVIFVTEAKRENYDPRHTIKRALVVMNGVDTDGFALPVRHALPRHGVAYVGRFIESKGLAILRHVTAIHDDIAFTLVGWGPEDPANWGRENVTVLHRPSRATIAEKLREAELALVPSIGEGIPLTALEALSSGTRVLIGAGSHRAENDVTRHLIAVPVDFDQPERTARIWAEEIARILKQKDARTAQETRHEAIEAAHSTRAMCMRHADIVTEVLTERGRIAEPSFG